MKTGRCRCCLQPTSQISMRFDTSLGFVCPSCFDCLAVAEEALAEAEISGCVIDKPKEEA